MKSCTRCGETKPIEAFARNRRWLRTQCKVCCNQHAEAWRATNRTAIGQRKRDRGINSDHSRTRQLRKRGVVIIEPVRRRAVFDRAGGRCQSCGVPLKFKGGWDLDHVMPTARSGVHSYANCQALCRPCHRVKSAAEAAA